MNEGNENDRLRGLASGVLANDPQARELFAQDVRLLAEPIVRGRMAGPGRPSQDMEDVLQRIQIEVFRSVGRVADPDDILLPDAFVRAIAGNTVRLYFREELRSGRRGTVFFSELGEGGEEENVAAGGREGQTRNVEQEETVSRFMERLTPLQQDIVARRMEGYPPRDIARELRLTEGAYQRQIRTIRQRFGGFIRDTAP